MFSYNRFWHFWHKLDNRNYVNSAFTASTLTLISVGIFFPAILSSIFMIAAVVIAPAVVITSFMSLLNNVSNFFYKRQNDALEVLKQEPESGLNKEQVDYYLNRRVVCPAEILKGGTLKIKDLESKATTKTPLIIDETVNLSPNTRYSPVVNRNKSYTESNNNLFMKEVAIRDGLYEVAASEMASLIGLGDVVPASAVSKVDVCQPYELQHSDELVLSRRKISDLINTSDGVKNTPAVQNLVAKFVTNLKTSTLRTQMNQGSSKKLTFVQSLIPNAKDGLTWFMELYNEPFYPAGQKPEPNLFEETRKEIQRENAKNLLKSIDQKSFEKTFLLGLILGSEDANPGNKYLSKSYLVFCPDCFQNVI